MTADGTSRDQRAQAKALAGEGLSCRAIADRVGVSRTTVSRWAKEDGYTFDHSRTVAATEARQFDMRTARLGLAQKMHANADRALSTLDGPFLVYNFGGKDNDYNEHTLAEAPLSARREAQAIGGIAFDKLTKAMEKDPEAAAADASSMLAQLGRALGIGADPVDNVPPSDDG